MDIKNTVSRFILSSDSCINSSYFVEEKYYKVILNGQELNVCKKKNGYEFKLFRFKDDPWPHSRVMLDKRTMDMSYGLYAILKLRNFIQGVKYGLVFKRLAEAREIIQQLPQKIEKLDENTYRTVSDSSARRTPICIYSSPTYGHMAGMYVPRFDICMGTYIKDLSGDLGSVENKIINRSMKKAYMRYNKNRER